MLLRGAHKLLSIGIHTTPHAQCFPQRRWSFKMGSRTTRSLIWSLVLWIIMMMTGWTIITILHNLCTVQHNSIVTFRPDLDLRQARQYCTTLNCVVQCRDYEVLLWLSNQSSSKVMSHSTWDPLRCQVTQKGEVGVRVEGLVGFGESMAEGRVQGLCQTAWIVLCERKEDIAINTCSVLK